MRIYAFPHRGYSQFARWFPSGFAGELPHDRYRAPPQRIFDLALPPIAYHEATEPAEVHRLIGEARAQGPVAMGPYGPELLTYDLVRSVLRDSRFAIPPGIGLVVQGITSGPVWDRVCKLLISLNGAEHQRLRRLVARAFTPRAAERMRAACVDVITELVDAQAPAGHCDVVTDIARPYPVPIICALLGAPRDDWQLFSRWSDDLSRAFGCTVTQNESAIVAAWQQLESYIEELIARRRRSLGDDLTSELIRAEDNGDKLTHDELVNLAVILLNAGTDTTRNQLAAAVQALSEHPDQWELLANRPELAPQAVEELIRYSPITFSELRVATRRPRPRRFLRPDGQLRHRQHGLGQSRPSGLRRTRTSGPHPPRRAGDDDVRRGRALLPRRSPGQGRAPRGAAGHHPAHFQPAAHRTRAVAAADRALRADDAADRVRVSVCRSARRRFRRRPWPRCRRPGARLTRASWPRTAPAPVGAVVRR